MEHLSKLFEIAGGSIIGTHHYRSKKNNQDSYYWVANDDAIVAFVCDGCGSHPHSEVGAKIGVRLLAEAIAKDIQRQDSQFNDVELLRILDSVTEEVLGQLHWLSRAMSSRSQDRTIIADYLLFTAVGIIITPSHTWIISLGDGVTFLNGETCRWRYGNDAPPYLAYNLLTNLKIDPELLQFQIRRQLPTSEVKSVLIGTDGVDDLLDFTGTLKKTLPGRDVPLGPISQFWEKDLYFKNPDGIRRKLFQCNKESVKPDYKKALLIRSPGLLQDDTTLITIRRKNTVN